MSKNGSSYDIALLDEALEVLKRRRKEIALDEPFVFPANSESGHMTDVKKTWDKFRKACGFPDVRLHDATRRTAASWMAIHGTSQKQIADALGHASLQSTEIYAHLSEQAVREAREAGSRKMRELTIQARKRLKLQSRKPKSPKLLKVSNG